MSNVISLSKTAKLSLEKRGFFEEGNFNVGFALDISVSMKSLYRNGIIQELTERLLGLGMNLDSNKAIEIYLFGSNNHKVGEVSEGNIDGFVNREIQQKYKLEGSTHYAGVMKRIANDFAGYQGSSSSSIEPQSNGGSFLGRLFSKNKNTVSTEVVKEAGNGPQKGRGTIIFFITDGDNFDKPETRRLIKELSEYGIFWQFVGIGKTNFSFLEELDEMDGRYIDNANFFKVDDLKKTSDEDLYNLLVAEFPSWVKEARSRGMIN